MLLRIILLALAAGVFLVDAQKLPIYINAGGRSSYTDGKGNIWVPDSTFTDSGSRYTTPPREIAGTQDDDLFRAARYFGKGSQAVYKIGLPRGLKTAQIKLHFVESFSQPGNRVFDIKIQGAIAAFNLDIVESAGGFNRAFTMTHNTDVSCSLKLCTLYIQFIRKVGEPKISAIEIQPLASGSTLSPVGAPPTNAPTQAPTQAPTPAPTIAPTQAPTRAPTIAPTQAPTIAPTSSPTQTPFEPIRINAGGKELIDLNGNTWSADTSQQGGSYASGGCLDSGIEQYYCTERFYKDSVTAPWGYTIPVRPGTYEVTLHFSEVYYTEANKRVFQVLVDGKMKERRLDIVSRTGGKDRPLALTYTVNIAGEVLAIELRKLEEHPKISAIEIVEPPPPPTDAPSPIPTASPSSSPSSAPVTASPTGAPTAAPSSAPVPAPTGFPTFAPVTGSPTRTPTSAPTRGPSRAPTTGEPTSAPTRAPTTGGPTRAPVTRAPVTRAPVTRAPATRAPTTRAPTTRAPTTRAPTTAPTRAPSTKPTSASTGAPVSAPKTKAPTTTSPTAVPVVPSDGIIGFTLIHAPTNVELVDLVDGMVVDLQALGGVSAEFSIRAVNKQRDQVKSVRFVESGVGETAEPFAYCGDNGGDYKTCADLGLGSNVVTVIPFPGKYQSGTAFPTVSVSFTIVASSPAPLLPTDGWQNGKWIEVEKNATIDARHEACFVMVGRKAYLVGGRGFKDIDIYDPVTRTWSKGAEPPIQMHHMQCVAAQGKLWVVSAWTWWYPEERNAEHVYVYDPAANTWDEKTAMPQERRRGAAAVVVSEDESKIYVSHGNSGGHETDSHDAKALGYLDVYTIATDSWTALSSNAPNPRDHTGGAMVNGRICVAGGRDGGSLKWPEVAATDCYDLATGTWTVEADVPQVRAGASYGTTCDGKLMIAGGEGSGKAWDQVDVFDGASWTTIDNLVIARHGSGLAVDCVCNQIHIASGAANQGGGPEIHSVETLFPGGVDVSCNQ